MKRIAKGVFGVASFVALMGAAMPADPPFMPCCFNPDTGIPGDMHCCFNPAQPQAFMKCCFNPAPVNG